tara:strand:- start:155 stop:781 length:627 start_codon:yes stop_codon:yes gene_type:complete
MCSIALAGLALGVGSAGAQYVGQRQQAKQQARYQAQASAAERQRALQEQRSVRMRQAQEQEATNRELADVALKSREALATATVSAGESGVAGLSVDQLLRDYENQSIAYSMGVTRQQEMKDLQTGLALTDAGYRSRSNLININRPINKPSFLTAALDAGSRGLSGYRAGLDIQRSMVGGSSFSKAPLGTKTTSYSSYSPDYSGTTYYE